MGNYTISVIHGDGIGPEVGVEGVRALKTLGEKFGHTFAFKEYLAGGAALDKTGVPMSDDTIKGVKDSHALLFGAIGGPKWESMPHHLKPEAGLLKIRKELGAFANLRPAVVYDELLDASTIKPEVLKGTDVLVVRELTGEFILVQAPLLATARIALVSTPKCIPPLKSNASAKSLLKPHACVAKRSVRLIKPTCWCRASCGAK